MARRFGAARFMRETLKTRSGLRALTLEKMEQPIEQTVVLDFTRA
ncbi:MAG: hypothetical protein ABJA83_02475 [Burkholderiaceae bacterium]